ncbi:MAG: hypothetical protein RL603_2274 [Pseudomonadota bacterium]|jgi:hypothetical protein
MINRPATVRAFASWVSLAALLVGAAFARPVLSAEPALQRIRMATVATTDLAAFERDYSAWLGYEVRERGKVSRELARSWGAPAMAGRPYVLMSSNAAPDVYIRAVRTARIPQDYAPLMTHGWNAIEIIVDNPDVTFANLRGSPFRVIGEPAPLGGYPTIRAFQVIGPSGEVLYLTAETGDRSKSILPQPGGAIGRIFIMVLAGPDIEALLDFYSGKFDMTRATARKRTVGVIKRAQGLGDDETPLATMRLAQAGNLVEFDGYSPKAIVRPVMRGELPPGIALTSFAVKNLDALKLDWISPPAARQGAAYAGKRSATARGPAGELIELIEE